LGKETFAGMGDKEEDAPIPVLPAHAPDRGRFVPKAVIGPVK